MCVMWSLFSEHGNCSYSGAILTLNWRCFLFWIGPFQKLMHMPKDFNLLNNKMPATLALRVMLGLIHLFQLYASPIDNSILANGIV